MANVTSDTIKYEARNGVATLTLNRPEAFNAFTPDMNQVIIKTLKQAGKDADVRVIVLTGAGRAFCGGEDLGGVDEQTNHADVLRERYHPMLMAMKETPKPIIAAINGTAAGAGMSLALAADFRLMRTDAKFVSAFMNIGLIPDSGFLYMLPRLVGYAKALEIVTLGNPVSGQEAYELGIVTQAFSPDGWDEGVQAFTERLAAAPTQAFSLVKRYMMDSMHETYETFLEKEAQAQRIAGKTADHAEGLSAFKEKRRAQFTGQ
ncbi:2-(1,2-epoxy-1,2-dihydrophenyl)acetyl-CoA isomerase [Lentibacillus sp. JNUCC-1]|uniref:enoyl-CoA hydratase/isomerase family protein n=1 Tax=Lentibacillus sp. JNUCC-1 TaxID=2654513 RepID=UPI0012E8937C|nr:enoyl-CoA hydratase-related protein [Lentibacillus sp. JNUCC-1]MUV37543.1 2-(1,2-epoxy-1,2-dihydrophenyl)acetyl-CoA isomerase [Lentibacillus sp. JNUCC-1]